jgi:valyl-tRNA synthetase
MSESLAKRYDPKEFEERWYRFWEERGFFTAHPEEKGERGERFCLVIPPPNVTGTLHMGHAFEDALMDCVVRWKRMQGLDTLWLPGTDHAGIATQIVVEQELAKEGRARHELGREKFVERVWKWKQESGGVILKQLRRMGASCDWSREKFTMEPALSRAVQKVFVELYREGLVYRGEYIVNWCPRCQTALSDLEASDSQHNGHLWYVRYPEAGGDGGIVVATTRPETMLGDTGVAVHPEDERFRGLLGKKVVLPLVGREIPVVADPFVDKEFGTGAVKVTPAHDANDFDAGKRCGLPRILRASTASRRARKF